ncbi:DNA-directed RNA polymerase subunit K [Candidatus Woesearchaeota archaeon]|nr:DNA-directed RNA polymerase subunit K [Candidatus Woesearchaeota archaeon]
MSSITKYERARMIGSRALQISMGAPFLVKIDEDDLQKLGYNPIEIAKREFEADVLPITVRRPMPKREHKNDQTAPVAAATS